MHNLLDNWTNLSNPNQPIKEGNWCLNSMNQKCRFVGISPANVVWVVYEDSHTEQKFLMNCLYFFRMVATRQLRTIRKRLKKG